MLDAEDREEKEKEELKTSHKMLPIVAAAITLPAPGLQGSSVASPSRVWLLVLHGAYRWLPLASSTCS